MGSGDDLDPLDELGVPWDLTMIVPVGAHEIGQHLGITRVRLCPRDGVAVPIPRGGHRVDRVNLVARTEQRRHDQAAIDLDADRHFHRLVGVRPNQGMELGHALDAVGNATFAEHLSALVHHADIMMVFSPVHTDEDHCFLLSTSSLSPEERSGDLMDQCSRHDTPTAVRLLTDRSGHDLTLGLKVRGTTVLPNRRLGDQSFVKTDPLPFGGSPPRARTAIRNGTTTVLL